MAQITSYDVWMKDTSSLTSPRSSFLKLLDEALKTYSASPSADEKVRLKTAFDRWRFEQSKQGKDWRTSVRNQKGAMTNLYRALDDLDKRKLSEEEIEALHYIAAEQKLALAKQFALNDVKFKASTLVGMVQGAGNAWQKFKTGARSGEGGASVAKDAYGGAVGVAKVMGGSDPTAGIHREILSLLKAVCHDIAVDEVLSALHLGSTASFIADVTPVVGLIWSAGKSLNGWIVVAKQAHTAADFDDRRFAFMPGNPTAALNAVKMLLDREIAADIAKATRHTVAFTAKALGVVVDGTVMTGPVVGLVELLAAVLQTAMDYVRDALECRAGSHLLQTGALDFTLFETCPILGCYFLVVQDHSTIINLVVGDYCTPNFVFDAEQLIKTIDPILAMSRMYIQTSRLEVPHMSRAKGVIEQNYSVKTGLDKLKGLPEYIKDSMSNKIEEWIVKPNRVVVDKLRIRGIGPKP